MKTNLLNRLINFAEKLFDKRDRLYEDIKKKYLGDEK